MCKSTEMDVEEFERFYNEKHVGESFADIMGAMDTSGDKSIEIQEFLDYYCNISPLFDDDEHFEAYVKQSWKVQSTPK